MNEAFEKIIDELKQESIIVDDDAGHRAVEIIEQIAAEYNNGWIACSERLPEESGTYIVNAIENSIIHVTFAKWMPRMKKWNLTGCRSYWKVNAWQPLPEPFKERD